MNARLKGNPAASPVRPAPTRKSRMGPVQARMQEPQQDDQGFLDIEPQSRLLLAQTTCPEAQAPVRRSPRVESTTLFDPCPLTRGPDTQMRAAHESRRRAAMAAHELTKNSVGGVTFKHLHVQWSDSTAVAVIVAKSQIPGHRFVHLLYLRENRNKR